MAIHFLNNKLHSIIISVMMCVYLWAAFDTEVLWQQPAAAGGSLELLLGLFSAQKWTSELTFIILTLHFTRKWFYAWFTELVNSVSPGNHAFHQEIHSSQGLPNVAYCFHSTAPVKVNTDRGNSVFQGDLHVHTHTKSRRYSLLVKKRTKSGTIKEHIGKSIRI